MKWLNTIVKPIGDFVELAGRVRTLNTLRRMRPRLLRDIGYDTDLIDAGLAGWPWRAAGDKAGAIVCSASETAARDISLVQTPVKAAANEYPPRRHDLAA